MQSTSRPLLTEFSSVPPTGVSRGGEGGGEKEEGEERIGLDGGQRVEKANEAWVGVVNAALVSMVCVH